MNLNFAEIEKKWKAYWKENQTYKVVEDTNRPKKYILDMFPYPSGAGLHVGHPLGYIASDIYARYHRMKGFNVLHPMGFDAFGLPAEQYAIETGQHPAVTTRDNIERYKNQLNNIGFSYDWDREVITSDPKYYKWTQWIFLQLYDSWYNRKENKAQPINKLETIFQTEGNTNHPSPSSDRQFSAEDWQGYSAYDKEYILMEYRLAYQGGAEVNWCEALGTVLANDEVVNGVSERGAHPVVKRKMKQWFLRITEYADRLLDGLQNLDWSTALKDIQTNWIGKSKGAQIKFAIMGHDKHIEVFTTRPDTVFGVSFMVLAPELDLVKSITPQTHLAAVEDYQKYVSSRSDRERMTEVKHITGVFTGAYASHPFTGEKIPIWISEYVLAGYGTGAIMAVPAGDDRDFKFARHFNIEIKNIFGDVFTGEEPVIDKNVILHDSGLISGMSVQEAQDTIFKEIEKRQIGHFQINYKLRDAGFSRQRYWGEPFPITYQIEGHVDSQFIGLQGDDKWDIPLPLQDSSLPVILPEVDSFRPTGDGQSPLANNADWVARHMETDTMPGYAGSSWYFMRYTDPHNTELFASKEALHYWGAVDVYFGGAEHAVGHLLYARMWTMALYDLGLIPFQEPFQKLVNQGMIQGTSKIAHRVKGEDTFVSYGLIEDFETDPIHVDVSLVDGDSLDVSKFKNWRDDFAKAEFILEDDKFICESVVEKMSKRYHNVVNPDDMVAQYGADTFRLYEMFLGPLEMSKPWETKGIEGVSRFFKKLWRLFYDDMGNLLVVDEPLTAEENKLKHSTIKKIAHDCENFNFNTSVSQFMITVNHMQKMGCHKRELLESLVLTIAPFAPHMAEEFYQTALGHDHSVFDASFPDFDESILEEKNKMYPIAINGKPRTEMEFPISMNSKEIEIIVLKNEIVQKYMDGKSLRKFIYVPGKMINLVIA